MKRLIALLAVGAMFASACSSDDSDVDATAESNTKETTTTAPDVEGAFSAFCTSATTLIDDLDQYTGLFESGGSALTVGQVKAGSEDLTAARTQVEQDAEALEESIQEFNSIQAEKAKDQEEKTGTTSTTVVEVPVDEATIEQVTQAEQDFDTAVEGISDDTTLSEAEIEFQSAAFALQVSWTILLTEAGCLEEDQQALDDIRQFTAGVQTDLTTLGFYSGKVDGIYGTETVDAMQAFQKSVGLPETGLPDPATQKAMSEKLAANTAVNVAALQGLLAGLGLYKGPIDGVYNQQTEDAVKALQAALDVPQTGVMDPATWQAYADRRAGLEELLRQEEANATSTTTSAAPTTAAPTTAAPTTAAPTTAAPTTEAPTTTAAP